MDQAISNTQGMSQEVMDALARRGMGAQSQQAPMMSGGQAPPMIQPPVAPSPQMGAPAPQSTKFVPKDSHELLVSTLQESLKNEYKLKKEQAKFGQAPMI